MSTQYTTKESMTHNYATKQPLDIGDFMQYAPAPGPIDDAPPPVHDYPTEAND